MYVIVATKVVSEIAVKILLQAHTVHKLLAQWRDVCRNWALV
jgi:hypothetical protein